MEFRQVGRKDPRSKKLVPLFDQFPAQGLQSTSFPLQPFRLAKPTSAFHAFTAANCQPEAGKFTATSTALPLLYISLGAQHPDWAW